MKIKLVRFYEPSMQQVHLGAVIDEGAPVWIPTELIDPGNVHVLATAAGRKKLTRWLKANSESAPRAEKRFIPLPSLKVTVVMCVGMNYRQHCVEGGMAIPTKPEYFGRSLASLAGSDGFCQIPDGADGELPDYEGELAIYVAVLLRQGCRRESIEEVMKRGGLWSVAMGDQSLRARQFRGTQFPPGKSMDGSAPMSPVLIDPDFDPDNAVIRTFVNGEIRQESSTSDRLFQTVELLHDLTRAQTVRPGYLLLTGTPFGVCFSGREQREGVWSFKKPNFPWLKHGDVITGEVEGIGSWRSTMTAKPKNAYFRTIHAHG